MDGSNLLPSQGEWFDLSKTAALARCHIRAMEQQTAKFTHVDVADRRTFWIGGQRQSLIVGGAETGGRYVLSHSAIPAGGGAAEHVHGAEAEAFYVLAGQLRFAWEGDSLDVGPGSFLHLEPGLAYSFTVIGSQQAELLIIYAPAGLEHFISGVGVQDANNDEAASRQAADRSLEGLEAMKASAGVYGLTYTRKALA